MENILRISFGIGRMFYGNNKGLCIDNAFSGWYICGRKDILRLEAAL